MPPRTVKIAAGIAGAVSYLLTLLFILIFICTLYYDNFYPQTVVMETVEFRSSPARDESYKTEIMVNEGTLVELKRTYNDFGEVILGADDKTGWIKLDVLERL